MKHPYVTRSPEIPCPQCKAPVGELCVESNGVHLTRVRYTAQMIRDGQSLADEIKLMDENPVGAEIDGPNSEW